ncbi:hypothetical protein GGS21DRAFT_497353 [Xylaria nigripes]|nr:hypothetical protein GGS21DRAFT_497353 [Xylaria nigripes]
MESLRTQLADTQSALTERDKKFRQLRAEYNSEKSAWLQEKSALEAKIARLELENLEIQRRTPFNAPSENPSPDDVITMTRAQIKQAEVDYIKLVDRLSYKTRECSALEDKLALSNLALVPESSDEQIVERWNELRQRISTFSLVYLNKIFEPKLMSEACQRDLKALSPHWKTYTNTEDLPCYLFRAFIWRYLLRFFDIFCRAYGRDISKRVSEMDSILCRDALDADCNAWRIRTARLVHDVYPLDDTLVNEVTQKILESITPIMANKDAAPLKSALYDIVKKAADLSAVFDRSNFIVLMKNEPGSPLLHSFPYEEKLMDIVWTLGSKSEVDLMITPCLLKKDSDDYSVVVKAEVACG